jgi:arsenite-transporting ATPase
MAPQLHFFVGKGGVGKSTSSALSALFLAAAGQDTLLVSMDPAHNQRDLFETRFGEKPRPVRDRLSVKEIDTAYWIALYLKQTRQHLQKSYLYQSAFNLEDHFKVLQFSPGLEEYALLLAFENVLAQAADKDVIIFDMAPTALTLRFFSLPAITLTWLGELLKLRTEICRKKEIISKIRIGTCELESDRVRTRLESLISSHSKLKDILLADSARIHLVLNADRLSLAEARRIRTRMAEIGKPIYRVVVNKCPDDDVPADVVGIFPAEKKTLQPRHEAGGLQGLATLEAFVARHGASFEGLGSCA